MVIVGSIWREYLGRRCRFFVLSAPPKKQQPPADGNLIVESNFLCNRFARQHKNRRTSSGSLFSSVLVRGAVASQSCIPRAIPNRGKVLRLFRFQIQVQRNQRPIAMISVA